MTDILFIIDGKNIIEHSLAFYDIDSEILSIPNSDLSRTLEIIYSLNNIKKSQVIRWNSEVINTTKTQGSIKDSYSIRRTSLMNNIPYYTTIAGAKVAVDAIENLKNRNLVVKSLQSIH